MSGDRPPLGELRRFSHIDSTNTYLLGEARRGAPEGIWATADHQSAGRGRLGRRWEAPPGSSVLASLLLRPVLRPADLHLCTAVVALAGADACAEVAAVAPGLKWPNDLVVDDRKLAGVLAESDPRAPGGPPGSTAVVVGIGLNVDWPGPPDAGGTCLAELRGSAVDREALLGALRASVDRRRPDLDSPDGRRALADELRRRCVTLGRRVAVTTSQRTFTGEAVDIGDGGHLLVATVAGTVEVSAGDVVHLRPADEGPAG